MSDQTMMLDVPPGPEPVSNPTPEAPKERKAPRKDRARGIVKTKCGSDDLIVMMRPDKMIVRQPGKRHRNEKPLCEVVDFIVGQGGLFRHNSADTQAVDALAELLVAIEQDSPLLQLAMRNAEAMLERSNPDRLREARG